MLSPTCGAPPRPARGQGLPGVDLPAGAVSGDGGAGLSAASGAGARGPTWLREYPGAAGSGCGGGVRWHLFLGIWVPWIQDPWNLSVQRTRSRLRSFF